MIRIEAATLEQAYRDAASSLDCSVTQILVEVVQYPSSGFLGMFKKSAIIVATLKKNQPSSQDDEEKEQPSQQQNIINTTIMPESFVSDQDEDEDEEELSSGTQYTADYEEDEQIENSLIEVASEVEEKINTLFGHICFDIEHICVSVYDESTLLVEFKGSDSALLIGKEGYRYKALSYMIFNWININYGVQLRLEIAEFLQNQEEAVQRYLVNVCENIDKDGRAQTKILDGVLVQIALRELRQRYPQKYVAIRTTRDGLKFIIINDYHS